MAGRVNGAALGAIAAGSVFTYAGIKGFSVLQVVQSVIKGQSPAGLSATEAIDVSGTEALQGSAAALSASANVPPADLTGTEQANRALGEALAASYGWIGTDWKALDYGWGHLESGWNSSALNGSWPSGAYGIPQAHPGNKMPKAAWPVADGGSNSATAQILWGLSYIKSEYGSPSKVPGWLGQPGYEGY